MKIHFTCSTAEFDTYRTTYFRIRDFLIRKEHVLTRDWLPHTDARVKTGKIEVRDIKEIYQANIKALKEADLVIIEDTVSNFSTGHQITLAIQMKKPTLVLWQGKKHRKFKQMFIHGIESNILKVVEYDEADLEDIITDFINKFENINETNRFHLVLSGAERQYLDWATFHKDKSRTQLIKDAIYAQIESDTDYRRYLVEDA